MTTPLRLISSMATRALLADLAAACARRSPAVELAIESVGGVDAARRVRAGEAFDAVVLAADAIDALAGEGHLVPGSRVDLVRSEVAVAVRVGVARPDIGSEAAVRGAVLAAGSVGYSTGPSGVQLLQLFERWGIAEQIRPRLVQAPPGVPVGRLVAEGRVELGFQQASELIGLPGITLLGPLPPPIEITTVFAAGLSVTSTQPAAARALLAWMASPATADIKHSNGMEAAA